MVFIGDIFIVKTMGRSWFLVEVQVQGGLYGHFKNIVNITDEI